MSFKVSSTKMPMDRYAVGKIVDFDSSTAWVEGVPGTGLKEWIKISFTAKKELKGFSVFPGVVPKTAKDAPWTHYARPKQLTLIFSDGSRQKIVLKDEPKLQVFSFEKETDFVKIYVADVYPGQSEDLAMAECRPVFDSGEVLDFSFSLDNQLFASDESVYALLELHSPLFESEVRFQPLHVVVCLDLATPLTDEMKQQLLRQMKMGLATLGSQDYLSLVALSDKVEPLIEAKAATDKTKMLFMNRLSEARFSATSSLPSSLKAVAELCVSKSGELPGVVRLFYLSDRASGFGDMTAAFSELGQFSLSVFDLSAEGAEPMAQLAHSYSGQYYPAVRDLRSPLKRAFLDLRSSGYHNVMLRLFKPRGYRLAQIHGGVFRRDGDDYLVPFSNLLATQTQRVLLRFEYEQPLSLQADDEPLYVQGVFRYHDQQKGFVQQRLLFHALPAKDERFSLTKQKQSLCRRLRALTPFSL
ncbi:MAG: hypothetical protein VW378_06720 [bacterium]